MTAPHWCCSSYLQITVPIKSISIKILSSLSLFQCKHSKASDYQSQPKSTSDKLATVIRLAARSVMTTVLGQDSSSKQHLASCYRECVFNHKGRKVYLLCTRDWKPSLDEMIVLKEKKKNCVYKRGQSFSQWVRCLKYLTSSILFTFLGEENQFERLFNNIISNSSEQRWADSNVRGWWWCRSAAFPFMKRTCMFVHWWTTGGVFHCCGKLYIALQPKS